MGAARKSANVASTTAVGSCFAAMARCAPRQKVQEFHVQISAAHATLGAVWSRIVGTSASGHYGRPYAFHQQAQRADWAAAWSRVDAPVLAMYGEYDWFESRDATSLIARIVNAKRPGHRTFVEIPRMNHHFSEFSDATHAFRETNGNVNPDPAVKVMLEWLKKVFASPGMARRLNAAARSSTVRR